jgi:hypothetical protein
MNHNLIPKRTNKGISQIPEIDKIINIKQSTKLKSKNIINLYSTLTPIETANQKNKNLLISSNIKNIINTNNSNSNKNNHNTNINKNQNNINNDIIKKNHQAKNIKCKGSSSSTNIKTNYCIFKTKKLKSTTSLLNKNINHYGSSVKMNINMPKPNTVKNINKLKSKEKMISPFHNDKNTNVFRKSMSHTKIKFPFAKERNIDNNKKELLYVGSEPNINQKSLNNNKEYKNEIRKEIKKAFKRLLTLNTDFELGSLYKVKFFSNHLTNNSNNKSRDHINKISLNKKNKDLKNSDNVIKNINENENKLKNNCLRKSNTTKHNSVINNISFLNNLNSINNTVRLYSSSKSKRKNYNQLKNKNNYKSKNNYKNNYINGNKNKDDKISNINKNISPK